MITSAQFRSDFPEFANTANFPEGNVSFWLTIAMSMLNISRWGTMVNLGYELFAAHNLVLEAFAQKTAAVGGLPGLSKGAISSESPGAVSVSYDTASVLEVGAGHWNNTVYGSRFIRMARMFGAGPLQIMDGCNIAGSFASPTVQAASLALVNPAGPIDGMNFTFALPSVPPNGSVLVFQNGLALQATKDFIYAAPIASSGATLVFLNGDLQSSPGDYSVIGSNVVFNTPPELGDIPTALISTATGLRNIGLVGAVDGLNNTFLIPNSAVILTTPPAIDDTLKALYDTGGFQQVQSIAGVINGSNRVFTLASIPGGAPLIFLNGDSLTAALDFSIQGATLTLTAAPMPGDVLFGFF